ncbi:MAG: ATP-binding cassette domain-containing protein, partial [Firmicutes bacterium]|nr:ATP-binding cassette domain-containing protein [Bacillota bacterium]
MEILKVEGLTFSYAASHETKKSLNGVSFSANEGEFIVVSGGTGSGKSTLLRALKRELCPNGTLSGKITVFGRDRDTLDAKSSAAAIGFVPQHPEEAIVTDRVSHELCFGLENLGVAPDTIRRRAAETAAFFGMNEIYSCDTSSLSGGQKQMLVLASVMIMRPKLLLLDEPTSELDPISVGSFLSSLSRLNRELGLTIIMAEHRLEDVLYLADKMLILKDSESVFFGDVNDAFKKCGQEDLGIHDMPSPVRLFFETGGDPLTCGKIPLTVREGRKYITESFGDSTKSLEVPEKPHETEAALLMKNVCFRYTRDGRDILKGLDLTVYSGQCVSLVGGNGAGKSTCLSAAAGVLKPYAGKIEVFGKKLSEYKNGSLYTGCVSLLPQNTEACFLYNTVGEELSRCGYDKSTGIDFDFDGLLERHPYDISGGEAQMLALAKAVSRSPRLLLLDEPTKGLDGSMKEVMKGVISELKGRGVTILAVTHDIEFAAEISDTISMLFD